MGTCRTYSIKRSKEVSDAQQNAMIKKLRQMREEKAEEKHCHLNPIQFKTAGYVNRRSESEEKITRASFKNHSLIQ